MFMTSECYLLPEPYGKGPAGGYPLSSFVAYDDVFPQPASPPHAFEDSFIDLSEASQVPLPYDDDNDDMVPGDEVSISFICL